MDIALRHYETVFVLTPVLTSEQTENSINKFRSFFIEKKRRNSTRRSYRFKKASLPYSAQEYRYISRNRIQIYS